jgi:hypothetical protein
MNRISMVNFQRGIRYRKRRKIRRTVYFTNHPKILKKLELFAKENKITLSATILGFCAMGLMIESLPGGADQLRDATKEISKHLQEDTALTTEEINKHLQDTPSL